MPGGRRQRGHSRENGNLGHLQDRMNRETGLPKIAGTVTSRFFSVGFGSLFSSGMVESVKTLEVFRAQWRGLVWVIEQN